MQYELNKLLIRTLERILSILGNSIMLISDLTFVIPKLLFLLARQTKKLTNYLEFLENKKPTKKDKPKKPNKKKKPIKKSTPAPKPKQKPATKPTSNKGVSTEDLKKALDNDSDSSEKP